MSLTGRLSHRKQSLKRRLRAKEIVNKIKLASGCIDCGFKNHPSALDFDHVKGKKKFTLVAGNLNYSIKTIMKEMQKCVVRCANCHRIKSWSDRKRTGGVYV